MRPDELRFVIRSADGANDDARRIPVQTFTKSLSALLAALRSANAALHNKKFRSEFFISHLSIGSNIVGVLEQRRSGCTSPAPAIDLFKQCVSAVYHSNYARVVEHTDIAKSIVKIGKSIDEAYPSVVSFPGGMEIPFDTFFAKQTEKLESTISNSIAKAPFFVGSTIGAFDGRLESLDYSGAVWKGSLVLPGGSARIECIFDRSKGENEYNPFGNKRVSITGKAIYTGESQLPERIEVISIQEVPLAMEAIDIRGSLTGKHYFHGWDIENKNLQ